MVAIVLSNIRQVTQPLRRQPTATEMGIVCRILPRKNFTAIRSDGIRISILSADWAKVINPFRWRLFLRLERKVILEAR